MSGVERKQIVLYATVGTGNVELWGTQEKMNCASFLGGLYSLCSRVS
jgi:hypothetical protein